MEFNYLVEKKRMIKSLGNIDGKCRDGKGCEICPLSSNKNGRDTICSNFEVEHPLEATEIVKKWAEEHPRKTKKDVLLEKFPKAELGSNGVPITCTKFLGFDAFKECVKVSCEECWNTEVEE